MAETGCVRDLAIQNLEVTGTLNLASTASIRNVSDPSNVVLVADADNDTTITTVNSGDLVLFGTATGAFGAADGNNASTFKLPSPSAAGERITFLCTNAAAIEKKIGFHCASQNTDVIRYQAHLGVTTDNATANSETGVTATNATYNGANTVITFEASKLLSGDKIECISLGSTAWLMTIHCNLLAAGDIAPAAPAGATGAVDA